jgi:hypothetical protein
VGAAEALSARDGRAEASAPAEVQATWNSDSMAIITRGNTVFLDFTFYDEDGVIAVVGSAEVQLTYPDANGWETEVVTLTNDSNVWSATWDSTAARPGWVSYHAHSVSGSFEYAQDGRFRLSGNHAGLDHDTLPTAGTQSDYGLPT